MYKIEMACINHMGYVRDNNEDNFYFNHHILEMEHESMTYPITASFYTKKLTAVAVFDGMGGENAGETASYIAAKIFSEKCDIPSFSKQRLTNLMESLNQEVCKKAAQDKLGQIGTTATILFFHLDHAYLNNVGDSPAYILRNGRLKLISEKHTNEELLRLSNIKNRKPALTQFLGIPEDEMAIEPYIVGMEIRKGDIFLLCSDGLTDMVTENEIADIMGKDISVSQMTRELLVEALGHGGRDNITVICCKVTDDKVDGAV